MSTEANIATIKTIYDAFNRADGQTILDNLTDDVDWGTDTDATAAPWWGVRHDKGGVAAFFEQFATAVSVEAFEPLTFAATGDDVLTIVRMEATVRETGRSVSMNLHHWFTFRDGKVARYRGTEDTTKVAAALAA